MTYSRIAIPEEENAHENYWKGTTDVRCPCGGLIRWPGGGYASEHRACTRCRVLYAVRGHGAERALVPQWLPEPLAPGPEDAPDGTPLNRLERVPRTYYPVPIPQLDETESYWQGTTRVQCPCGGTIRWAEAAYGCACRACDRCLVLYRVRGHGRSRALVPQMWLWTQAEGFIHDAPDGAALPELYRVDPSYFAADEIVL